MARGEVKPRSNTSTNERRAAAFSGEMALTASREAKSMASNDVMACFFFSSYSTKLAAVRPRTGLPAPSITVTGSSTT